MRVCAATPPAPRASPASRFGINSPKCYTDAYTVFGLKCIVAPEVPNNAASLAPFLVLAEEGSINLGSKGGGEAYV